ncbi:hypothetical protein CBM2615_B60081 [Cupriavidus taiwanensis]|uniref:Uncharacterized protein n=1 Tax=Cupriavidus taiwanensis TaxID=164546 RepID=A0A976B315_9BURK|nr:hypothetical protein CBM2614_B50077 [Cupriavidus taiwanensis]SOZ69733.1 hypothetical protein CBM2615_B60081 [Cupriavidus taiwanensis]SOZ72932.1 hypothetical protein CBM2613_B50080 [Cupriavidus taiwanensis]
MTPTERQRLGQLPNEGSEAFILYTAPHRMQFFAHSRYLPLTSLATVTPLHRDQKLQTCSASPSKLGSPDKTYLRPLRVMPALDLASKEVIAELTRPAPFSMQYPTK